MDTSLLFQNMARQAKSIAQLLDEVSPEQARWKADAKTWSLLEVACHFLDEEKYDFRPRLDLILNHPEDEWVKIDPGTWVIERAYNEADLEEILKEFLAEREKSLKWLQSLKNPNWDTLYEAPFGNIRAGDILTAWAAHDLLHIRQLNEIHWAYLAHKTEPYKAYYAGDW